MAITNNGTLNSLPASYLPSGYNKPSVATFEEIDWATSSLIVITKSAVEDIDPSVTMDNIVATITSDVTNLLADFDAALNGQAFANLISLTNNHRPINGDDYTTATVDYYCRVDIFVKKS